MFAAVVLTLLAGYPVAFTLSGVALIFSLFGVLAGAFDISFLNAIPSRIFGVMNNQTLIAVPLFVFMGVMLEKSRIAEKLLDTLSLLFGSMRGGLGISVLLVGMMLAASTGIVGATVVTMGLLSLPTMLRRGYDPALASGSICAAGTLGQVIPPSIVLVMLGDVLSSSYQRAQLEMGIFSPKTISVGDLFAGALFPGLMLVGLYLVWLLILAVAKPNAMPALTESERDEMHGGNLLGQVIAVLIPPLALIFAVLGSILAGIATPTEAAAVGAAGATLMALQRRQLNLARLREVMRSTARISSMVFMILIGASIFALVFRAFGGDVAVHAALSELPGGAVGAMFAVMVMMFLLGFVLDFIEVIFVVVPIVAPVLLAMGIDPIWLGVMIAINLQTSFLTPPFGFSLFYLRGVAPPELVTRDIYRGVIPFVVIQLVALFVLAAWPGLATWLPAKIYGG